MKQQAWESAVLYSSL